MRSLTIAVCGIYVIAIGALAFAYAGQKPANERTRVQPVEHLPLCADLDFEAAQLAFTSAADRLNGLDTRLLDAQIERMRSRPCAGPRWEAGE